jgi:hypothetical protein
VPDAVARLIGGGGQPGRARIIACSNQKGGV